MKLIGLTGTTGSGKSYVSSIISSYNIPVIDADKVTHGLYKGGECALAIQKEFGDVLSFDGSVDRKKLREIVFNDKEKLVLLQNTVFAFINKEIESLAKEAEKNGATALVIDAPTLFEAGLDKRCDLVVSVVADENIRTERIMKRDRISLADAQLRIKNQQKDVFFREKSDFVIENSGNTDVEKDVYTMLKNAEII